MKKVWAIILTMALMLSLVACGNGGGEETTFDIDAELRDDVKYAVMGQCAIQYANVKYTTVNITDISNDGDTYTVKGKAVVRDDYGDEYTGKFTAVYEYWEYNGSPRLSQESLDIETPTKK